MSESNSVARLLRLARLDRGMDLDTLASRTGVARNHLMDIELGSARSFHTLAYCRKAVGMVAREFGLEDQVAKAWRDEDWVGNAAFSHQLASIEVSPPALLPSIEAGQYGPARKWLAPMVGLLGLAFLGWLAIARLDQEPEAPVVHSAAPVVPQPLPAISGQAEDAMHEWIKLWRSRQIEAYTALYDTGFIGLDRHLAVRRQRMSQASFIEVEISELQSRETGPGEVTVRFRQIYRSDNYQSDDRKEMVWRQTPKGLKIIAERLVN